MTDGYVHNRHPSVLVLRLTNQPLASLLGPRILQSRILSHESDLVDARMADIYASTSLTISQTIIGSGLDNKDMMKAMLDDLSDKVGHHSSVEARRTACFKYANYLQEAILSQHVGTFG